MLIVIGLSSLLGIPGSKLCEALFQFCVMGLHLDQIAVFIKIYGSSFSAAL